MKKNLMMMVGLFACMGLLVLGAVHSSAAGSSAGNSTSQSIQAKQEQIKKAQSEKDSLKKNLTNVQEVKKKLESKKKDLTNYVAELDAQLAAIEERVASLKEQIVIKEEELKQTQAQLEEAIARENTQMENMIVRARMMYEKKDHYTIELLTQASGFGDLLNRAELMEKVVIYDKEQWTEFQNTRKYVELCEMQLELEKDILNQTRENVELEQNTIELFMEQKKRDIEAYQSDIKNQEQAIKEYEEMIRQQDEEIKALERAIEEERRRLQGLARTYDGGMFKFPLANYTRISDDYGNRIHPILKVGQFHNGVDFAAPKGTAIYAAYKGVVVAADYSPTMGNYVMIDHGDSLYTIYMHASSLKVKKDDVVATGDTIALVGSTGRSTGNHLHFSVRKDGSYVSPWEYITP
ncbi:MAG: peptidoglycan DD-metalloendopeptidase family protein [Lachnospiraceae bacterium]|nr:peptidoglycan DD-metalloendopeptidase family protein [Lachnospiraceae bacterium]